MRRFASDFAFSDAFLQLGTISGELVHGVVSYSRIATGKGQRTRELTTTCNGHHWRAGDD